MLIVLVGMQIKSGIDASYVIFAFDFNLKFVGLNYECLRNIKKYVERSFIGILVNIVIYNKQYSSFYFLRWTGWRIRFSLGKFTLFVFLKEDLSISNNFCWKEELYELSNINYRFSVNVLGQRQILDA